MHWIPAVVWLEWADWDNANMTNRRILNREQSEIKLKKNQKLMMTVNYKNKIIQEWRFSCMEFLWHEMIIINTKQNQRPMTKAPVTFCPTGFYWCRWHAPILPTRNMVPGLRVLPSTDTQHMVESWPYLSDQEPTAHSMSVVVAKLWCHNFFKKGGIWYGELH